jgi:LMBR1-like membrane protein
MPSQGQVEQYVGIVVPILICLCVYIAHYYAEPEFPWITYVFVITGYFCALGILFTVPPDIAGVICDRQISEDTSSVVSYDANITEMDGLYNVLFLVILILGSAVLPFLEYYDTDGYFTVGSRTWNACKRMLYDDVVGIVAGVIVLGVLVGLKVVPADANAIELAAIIVTNVIYETFLMILLGYGLVELPRSYWMEGNLDLVLKRAQMRAYTDFRNLADAQVAVGLIVADVMKIKAEVR